jgi:hypothetical protein
MTASEFVARIKLQAPNLGQSGVTDAYMISLLNTACNAVNALCKVYSGYTDFNIEANKRIYDLSTYVPTYLGRDKRGLFIKDADGNWNDVIPKSEAWLAERYPDYLNASSVELPEYYYIGGNELGFYPPPSTDRTEGARLYHLKKANPMTADGHYPFSGTTSEITAFIPLDDALLAWCRWKLSPAFGAVSDIDLRYREFLIECQKGAAQVRRSPDLMNDLGKGIKI